MVALMSTADGQGCQGPAGDQRRSCKVTLLREVTPGDATWLLGAVEPCVGFRG